MTTAASCPLPGVSPARWYWILVVCGALTRLADTGLAFAEAIHDRVMRPAGPIYLERELARFAKAALLTAKITAFAQWLRDGGLPDEAAIARRRARLQSPPPPPPPAAAHAKQAERRAGKRDDDAAPRQPSAAEDQARFRAWFASHTTEEVMQSFRRDLLSLARALERPEEAALITSVVDDIILSTGSAGARDLPVTRPDGSVPAARPGPRRPGRRAAAEGAEAADSG
jgi:hypothetical protein